MQCERTLVTLPVDIAKLRDVISSVEAGISELQPALSTLQEEQAVLSAQHGALETALTTAEAELATKRETLEQTRARVAELTTRTTETQQALDSSVGILKELSLEEDEMASAYGPMTEELQAQREEAVEIAKRLAKLQKRNDTLSAELSEASTTLGTNRAMYDGVRSKLRDTRLELQAVRKNSNRFAMEDEAARKEIEDSEALISALASEMAALKAESPVLVAKRDMVAKELEEALGNVERFESGPMAEALSLEVGKSAASEIRDGFLEGFKEGAASEGAALDARVERTSRAFEVTAQEVDGRLKSLSQFSETVTDAMNTAASKRDSAQRSLEQLAMEQRRASEEMKLTLNAALEAMAAMQGQWDEAVDANSAELRDLKRDAKQVADAQEAKIASVQKMRDDLDAEKAALANLVEQRRTLAEEEEKLRRRFEQLSERRQAKLQGKTTVSSADFEDIVESAGASAEKAVVQLFKLFDGSGKKDDQAALPKGDERAALPEGRDDEK